MKKSTIKDLKKEIDNLTHIYNSRYAGKFGGQFEAQKIKKQIDNYKKEYKRMKEEIE